MSYGVVEQFPLKEEYKKQTRISPQDIDKLREWLGTQPHLPGDHISDLDLILTSHCCGGSTEVAKQVLDLHYTLRTLFTSFFKNRFMNAKIERVLNVMLMTVLPTRSKEGYAVFYAYFLDKDPKNFVLADCFRTGLMVTDLLQYEQGTWPGFMLVFDLENMSLGHFAKVDIQSVQQYLYYLQEAMLVNLKAFHFLNAPSFMDKLLMIMRPFMSKSLMDLIHIHQIGSRTFDKFYPTDALPKGAIGGNNSMSLEAFKDEIVTKMKANKEFFEKENKKRVVEALRPGKPKTISDIFGGIEGSFKKLDID